MIIYENQLKMWLVLAHNEIRFTSIKDNATVFDIPLKQIVEDNKRSLAWLYNRGSLIAQDKGT